MYERSEFRDVIEQVCSGSHEAAWTLIERFGPHIKRVVRRRLSAQMRSKFDSADFVQMVWTSFFEHPQKIARFEQPEQLIGFLARVALNKVVDASRQNECAKHNVRKEQPLQTPGSSETPDRRADTPSQIAIARERWSDMVSHLSERDRRILEHRMSGATFVEIGRQLGMHERTVRHIVSELAGAHSA